ncbi:MAG: DUF2961 domain-containing protein [Verrucomicrobiia bacterium]
MSSSKIGGWGHYLGCNPSVANFRSDWWGEGDDMIWVDGYKWPPDLHGTGSEDYLSQAWGMQDNAFLRNGNTSAEGLKRIEADVLVHMPGLVLVEFGGNDAVHDARAGSPCEPHSWHRYFRPAPSHSSRLPSS